MILWRDIEGAPLDETECELYVVQNFGGGYRFRIPTCKFMHGAWCEFDADEGDWLRLKGFTPTHYAEITEPQEPLDWPTEPGHWWVNDGYTTEYWFVVTVSTDQMGAAGGGLPFQMYTRSDLCRHRFLPATPPSFGA